ncbi:MAG: hypothetical protein AB8G99_27145 [Planctomycetaceae bacterium]
MISPRSIASVFRFEMRQAATIPRMAWWLALALFPVFLTTLLQWADSKLSSEQGPEIQVVRIDVLEFSSGGTPTIEVDGKRLSGVSANAHIIDQGESDMKRKLSDAASMIFRQSTQNIDLGGPEEGPGRREGRGRPWRPSEPKTKPILLVQYPSDMSADDERLKKAEEVFEDAFARVVYFSADEPAPNLQPPSRRSLFWGAGLYILLPSVVAMLSTFLWAAPSIASELEGRSWAYIATRPHGPISVLLGKYLIGVVWGISAAMTGLTLSLLIANVEPEGYFYLFRPLCILILLACPAYGAVFTLIGAIAPRRAMVVSVAYALTIEGMISILPVLGTPALISRLSIQYPLRSMMVRWLRLDDVPENFSPLTQLAVSESTLFIDVLSIVLITAAALGAAVFAMQTQELTQADESDS